MGKVRKQDVYFARLTGTMKEIEAPRVPGMFCTAVSKALQVRLQLLTSEKHI